MTTSNSEGLDTYDVIGHKHQETNTPGVALANPTPGREEKGDDFYDAEQHTYSVVVKHKKKANEKTSEDGVGEGEGDEH